MFVGLDNYGYFIQLLIGLQINGILLPFITDTNSCTYHSVRHHHLGHEAMAVVA